MSFVAARCPQCGGELQLDNAKETGFCMHCGSKIVVQDAIRSLRIDNSHMIETWMNMGNSAFEAGNTKEAYEYFTKIVEVNPENWYALFKKGQAAGWQSTIANRRFPEFFQGISNALNIINKSNLSMEEIIEAKNKFVVSIHDLLKAFDGLIWKRDFGTVDKYYDSHWDLMWETREWHKEAIEYYKIAIGLIEDLFDDKSKANVIFLKKEIVGHCIKVCDYTQYYKDYNKEEIDNFGYNEAQKKPFIDLYDQLIMEIRGVEPEYWTEPDPYNIIDRFGPPSKFELNRRDRLLSLEKEIDKKRREKEENYQKQKYWEDHPEEYQAHLAEAENKKNPYI